MFDVAFDQVVSIGSACDCAMLLNDVGLRMASGPFDWILGTPFERRIELLCRRFDGFMLRENIAWKEEGRFDRASDVYRDRKLGYVFIHDFPKGVTLDESFPAVREKYMRRIERLLRRLDEGWATCLVWRSVGESVTDEACAAAAVALRKAFPKAECRILLVENDVSVPKGRLSFQPCDGGICLKARGCFVSSEAEAPMGDRKLQWKALRMLKCSPSLARQCRRHAFRRAIVRFLSLWHLTRDGRKRSRKCWEQRLYRKNVASSVGW